MSEINATIGRLIQNAQQVDASDIRTDLFDRYMGEPYGDEQEGRSKFVSTDVSDAVEAILPDLMDVFTSAEDIVEFKPVGPEDEGAAKQETAVVSHVFWEKNEGFTNLYVWIKEALIQQNSYIKRGWQEKVTVEVEEYEGLTPEELVSVANDIGEFEILEQSGGFDPETSMMEPISIKLRTVKREKRYVIECIPQEEFFITPRWGKIGLDGVPCCGHRRSMEIGELVAMGFDRESIDKANSSDEQTEQDESRFDTQDAYENEAEDGDESTREVMVYEAYCRVDIDDDGMAELVRVWSVGDGSTILTKDGEEAIEEVSCVPFSALTPYLVPHRHVGRSVAELVDDIQKVKTVLFRHTLDNVYLTNYPRPEFDENSAGPHTFNDLANPAPGAPIRNGGAVINWQMPPSVIGTTMPIIDKMDDLKEVRTGATRYNQGLDAESLNKTAIGVTKIMNASQKKTLLIARVIAETGLRDLFLGIHRDLRSGPWKDIAMKLSGNWIAVNPRTWADRTDMTVKVGMGTGDRENVRQGLMLMGNLQRELMAGGSRMVDESKVYETAKRMMATYGFKSLDPFMNDPTQLPPEQPKPDPAQQAAMQQMQISERQIAMAERELAHRLQLDAQKAQWEHERKIEELRIKAQAEERQAAKAASDILTDEERLELDRKRAVMDDDFKRDKLETDALTGAFRAEPHAVVSQPPLGYDEV